VALADGGETTVANLQLRCRAHNAYEAEAHFGPLRLREEAASYQVGPALLCQIVTGFWCRCRARSLGGRRDAERAAALRSRKARPAIPRADFPPCDPRKVEYHRRISAPNICRPHASVVGAGAEEYELGAVSRRAERRRPPRLLVLQKPAIDSDLTKVVPDRVADSPLHVGLTLRWHAAGGAEAIPVRRG
jgi:hypothetical protein